MMTVLLVLAAIIVVPVIAFLVDVYVIRWGQITVPAAGKKWHDGKNWYTLPPSPSGRPFVICLGHWYFRLPWAKKGFGVNDRLSYAKGFLPGDDDLAHEFWHAAIESREHGLLYLPWYFTHMAASEANAHTYAVEQNKREYFRELARYVRYLRTGRA